jgi:hypothetical protein
VQVIHYLHRQFTPHIDREGDAVVARSRSGKVPLVALGTFVGIVLAILLWLSTATRALVGLPCSTCEGPGTASPWEFVALGAIAGVVLALTLGRRDLQLRIDADGVTSTSLLGKVRSISWADLDHVIVTRPPEGSRVRPTSAKKTVFLILVLIAMFLAAALFVGAGVGGSGTAAGGGRTDWLRLTFFPRGGPWTVPGPNWEQGSWGFPWIRDRDAAGTIVEALERYASAAGCAVRQPGVA